MRIYIIAILIFFLLLITACSSSTSISEEKACTSDLDCIPAECCHPTTAVNKEYAPDCSKELCTLNCRPGTLDCGQGDIRCVEGACTAILPKQ